MDVEEEVEQQPDPVVEEEEGEQHEAEGGFVVPPDGELVDAIWRGADLDEIRAVVERRPELLRTFDRHYGCLPLHGAVDSGSSLEVLECLYMGNPEAVRTVTRGGEEYLEHDQILPLHCVGHRTPPECVNFLLDHYPRSIRVRASGTGDLSVHSAIFKGAPRDSVRVLVERYPRSVDELNAEGFLPIHAIADTPGPNQLEVMRYLLEISPQSVRERTVPAWGDGMTQGMLPLHLAIQSQCRRVYREQLGEDGFDPTAVRLLLEQWPGSARERAQSYLPLHFAVLCRSPLVELARLVLEAFPEALRDKDLDGSTVLHKAVRNGFVATANLLRLLVDSGPELLLEADAAGDLPIHVASGKEPPSPGTVGLLAERCAHSLRVANSQGQRPTHAAIANDSLPAVRILTYHSPGVLRDVDGNGNTPAHLAAACDYGSADLARYVAEAWPESLLLPNQNGDSPALVAIDRALPTSSDALEVFLDICPESVQVANANGVRPLFVAIMRNHLSVVNLIVERVPDSARHVDSQGNPPLLLAAENETMDLNSVFLLLKAWPDVVVLGGDRMHSSVGGDESGEGGGDADGRSGKRKRSESVG
jgi:ankyrin repeat protein